MSGFSFYDWVLHSAGTEQIELRTLGDAHSQAPPREESEAKVLTVSTRAMLHWCSIVEQLTRDRHARGARVYAGFERLSRVKPVLRRYQQLASVVDRLVVFAEHDEPLALDAEQIDAAGSALDREWFLVVYSPDYSALLAARDLDGFGPTGPLVGRRFVAVTARERTFIERAAHRLEDHVREHQQSSAG